MCEKTSALVLLEGAQCALTMAFTRMCDKCFGSKLPFTTICVQPATKRLRASREQGTFAHALLRDSETWMKWSARLKAANVLKHGEEDENWPRADFSPGLRNLVLVDGCVVTKEPNKDENGHQYFVTGSTEMTPTTSRTSLFGTTLVHSLDGDLLVCDAEGFAAGIGADEREDPRALPGHTSSRGVRDSYVRGRGSQVLCQRRRGGGLPNPSRNALEGGARKGR